VVQLGHGFDRVANHLGQAAGAVARASSSQHSGSPAGTLAPSSSHAVLPTTATEAGLEGLRTSPTIAVRYQHVMRGRDAAVADALDRLAEPADQVPSGTDMAREDRPEADGGVAG
jgi:hypothetical protein